MFVSEIQPWGAQISTYDNKSKTVLIIQASLVNIVKKLIYFKCQMSLKYM